jgi:hypothetical protein
MSYAIKIVIEQHKSGTRIEEEAKICGTNLGKKTKCMSTNVSTVSTASAICGVKSKHSRLKPYGNP